MFIKKKRGTLRPHNSSIVLYLKPILAARNIIHPTFLQKIGINSFTANKILKGEAVQVNFRQLTALCMNLNCTPNDLFALRQMQLPELHALHEIQLLTPNEESINITKWLAGKSVEEIRELMRA